METFGFRFNVVQSKYLRLSPHERKTPVRKLAISAFRMDLKQYPVWYQPAFCGLSISSKVLYLSYAALSNESLQVANFFFTYCIDSTRKND